MSSPKRINKFLHSDKHHLEELITHASAVHQLNQHLADYLGAPLNVHCQIANLRDGVLVLLADSPAWASRIRYQIPGLLQQLNHLPEFARVEQIKLRIRPTQSTPPPQKTSRETLSNYAAKCISAVAHSVRDTDLKSALQRLASRSKKDR